MEKQTEEKKQQIQVLADKLVANGVLTDRQAKTQVSATQDMYDGKISYAEMRRIAG